MIAIKLQDGWMMKRVGDDEWLPASVPGSVYSVLLENGRIQDPYYRDNADKALALIEHDFIFRVLFDAPEKVRASQQALLRFDGIDTAADLYLNGEKLGYVENMHRVWEFPVNGRLKETDNELQVLLHSPTRFIREADTADPILGDPNCMKGFAHLRKASCMFGWDWAPVLPDAGIWRDVSLIGFDKARLDSVYVRQIHEPGRVTLHLEVDAERAGTGERCRFERSERKPQGLDFDVILTDPQGNVRTYDRRQAMRGIGIISPKLWWPNGYGQQPLYTLEVRLHDNGQVLDRWKKRIGLRTMTIHREKDAYGEQFCHEVNGVRIFAMGADYVPEDSILSRITPGRTRKLLLQAKHAHYNCLRVWGGGHFPSDAFYDACDDLGLIVWQDFMFACTVYNLSEEFEENIVAEMTDNIKRLRHHASLGLWCGNNEMEMFVQRETGWVNKPSQKSDYIKMYEYIIPKLLKRLDPETFYWPASPSSGGGFDEPNDGTRGDTHYWDVWHANAPILEFRKHYFRYVSEFGFQSFPSLKTCETFLTPEDRNIFSYVMEKHQRNTSANGKIMNYMEQTFLYPADFDTLLYASQLLQAEAIRNGIEHFRRNRGRCMGTIVWQFNDCWPVASWSSIDYCGRWKALHYYEKRCYAPVLVSCEQEGPLLRAGRAGTEETGNGQSIRLNVANERRAAAKVTVFWELRDAGAQIRRRKEYTIQVPPLSAVWLPVEDLSDADPREDYISYACLLDGETVSSGTVLFAPPKYFSFRDPHLTVREEKGELVVTAGAYAKSVEIRNGADDLLLSDNYFDLNAGERRIRILRGTAKQLEARSVYDIR